MVSELPVVNASRHTHTGLTKKGRRKKGENLACANGQGKTGENRKSVGDRRQTTFSTFFAPKKSAPKQILGQKTPLVPWMGRILLNYLLRGH